jgi:anti-sigma regulatory factor (Ser/Thr protein kinase)
MNEEVVLRIALPKIPDIELVALEGLSHLARHLGIPDEKIGEARIVVTEAVINAFEHAGGNDSIVKVKFVMTTKKLVIFVQDFGKGFEPGSVEDPKIEEKIGSAKKRGWGLKLMKSLSDGFQIESGSRGTKITITKLLS